MSTSYHASSARRLISDGDGLFDIWVERALDCYERAQRELVCIKPVPVPQEEESDSESDSESDHGSDTESDRGSDSDREEKPKEEEFFEDPEVIKLKARVVKAIHKCRRVIASKPAFIDFDLSSSGVLKGVSVRQFGSASDIKFVCARELTSAERNALHGDIMSSLHGADTWLRFPSEYRGDWVVVLRALFKILDAYWSCVEVDSVITRLASEFERLVGAQDILASEMVKRCSNPMYDMLIKVRKLTKSIAFIKSAMTGQDMNTRMIQASIKKSY